MCASSDKVLPRPYNLSVNTIFHITPLPWIEQYGYKESSLWMGIKFPHATILPFLSLFVVIYIWQSIIKLKLKLDGWKGRIFCENQIVLFKSYLLRVVTPRYLACAAGDFVGERAREREFREIPWGE